MNGTISQNMPIGEPPAPAFKNRSTGLTVFGILTIMLGCVTGLMILILLVATAAIANNPNVPQTSMSGLVLPMFIYGGLAVALVWLGIGSIKARRWARALLLIFSWAWLLVGIFLEIAMVFVLPRIWANMPPVNGQPAMPPGTIGVMTAFMALFFGVFFICLPVVWIFFYANHHTQATVEMRDPIRRWTDACPLPVLALSLWLLISGMMMLMMPFLYHGVVPFFGVFLSGLPGSLVYLVIAAVSVYCAWRIYHMDVRAWWIILVMMLLYAVSSVMTFARHDIVEMYHLMGYPQAQIDQMQKTGLFKGNSMTWMTMFSMAPLLGFIVYVKKYLMGNRGAQA